MAAKSKSGNSRAGSKAPTQKSRRSANKSAKQSSNSSNSSGSGSKPSSNSSNSDDSAEELLGDGSGAGSAKKSCWFQCDSNEKARLRNIATKASPKWACYPCANAWVAYKPRLGRKPGAKLSDAESLKIQAAYETHTPFGP
jgi:hypothetical protein